MKINTNYPELDKEERGLRSFIIQLLEATFLFWELVIDLPDVYSLQIPNFKKNGLRQQPE